MKNENSQQKGAPAPRINIDVNQTEAMACESCGCKTFTQAYLMRKVSAIMSPTGEDAIMPIPVFECSNCGHVSKWAMPKIDDVDDDMEE